MSKLRFLVLQGGKKRNYMIDPDPIRMIRHSIIGGVIGWAVCIAVLAAGWWVLT